MAMSSPMRNGDEYDSEATDPCLLPKEPWVARWGSTARAVLLLGFGLAAAVTLISYGAPSSNAVDNVFRGIDDIIQETASHSCTNGYVPTKFDVKNHDSTLHDHVATQEVCEAKCDAEDGCKAIEYNHHAKHCFTSKSGHDCDALQHAPWVSCVKKGENIKDDGECKEEGEETDGAESNETSCSGATENCMETRCCADEGFKCYMKNQYFSNCNATCNTDHQDDYDKSQNITAGWNCTELKVEETTKCAKDTEDCSTNTNCCDGADGTKMICFIKADGWSNCNPTCNTTGENSYDKGGGPWSCEHHELKCADLNESATPCDLLKCCQENHCDGKRCTEGVCTYYEDHLGDASCSQ
mmetsp:Transcript_41231/g.79013  ORF Transcript_41231/g.79013 Transcript_41231/m.79013 type:complete len:355 (+) Transcript_41231:1-1065(+)